MSVDDLLKEMEKKTSASRDELLKKIDAKYEELFGLVTKEGAAYIVAKDYGINVENGSQRRLQIKNIVSGIRNVNIMGRIFKISSINEFERNGGKGKVANIFIADETGFVKIPLWNDQVHLVEDGTIKNGDVVQITGGYAKENNFGDVEISLGKFGHIKILEEAFDLPTTDELNKKYFSNVPQRTAIKDLVTGNFEVVGTVVHVFEGRFLFDSDGDKAMFVSFILDDGTSDIRVTLFRDVAEKACQISVGEFVKMDESQRSPFIKEKLVGCELSVFGKVKENDRHGQLELIASSVTDLNPLDESKKIAEQLETRIGV